MGKRENANHYEIGYGKPPQGSQFKKGTSGNPTGRPKKALDFNEELIKEASSIMSVNENGHRKRMSKHTLFIKQLIKHAISGNPQASRTYLGQLRLALESCGPVTEDPVEALAKRDLDTLTYEELMLVILAGESKEKLLASCRDTISASAPKSNEIPEGT